MNPVSPYHPMLDPRQIASQIVGVIDWQSEVSGFCRCPGEALHTHQTGKKHCRVNLDGAPTIYCFHSSCAPAVAEANRRLRRELGGGVAVGAEVAGWAGVAKWGCVAEGRQREDEGGD